MFIHGIAPVKKGFNTQPPEGGWMFIHGIAPVKKGFNTQPPEGGWRIRTTAHLHSLLFQHTAA